MYPAWSRTDCFVRMENNAGVFRELSRQECRRDKKKISSARFVIGIEDIYFLLPPFSFEYGSADLLYDLLPEIRINGETEDMGGDVFRDRSRASVIASVAGEMAGQRIKILSCEDVFLREPLCRLVPGVFAAVLKDDRIIGEISFQISELGKKLHSRNLLQEGIVYSGNFSPSFDVRIDMAQITESHCGVKLAELCIGSDIIGVPRSRAEPEITQVTYSVTEIRIDEGEAAALDCMKDLRGMEGIHGEISVGREGALFVFRAEAVGRIIDHI